MELRQVKAIIQYIIRGTDGPSRRTTDASRSGEWYSFFISIISTDGAFVRPCLLAADFKPLFHLSQESTRKLAARGFSVFAHSPVSIPIIFFNRRTLSLANFVYTGEPSGGSLIQLGIYKQTRLITEHKSNVWLLVRVQDRVCVGPFSLTRKYGQEGNGTT